MQAILQALPTSVKEKQKSKKALPHPPLSPAHSWQGKQSGNTTAIGNNRYINFHGTKGREVSTLHTYLEENQKDEEDQEEKGERGKEKSVGVQGKCLCRRVVMQERGGGEGGEKKGQGEEKERRRKERGKKKGQGR